MDGGSTTSTTTATSNNHASRDHQTNGGSSSTRGICRYYSTKGECYYGSECQYLHQNPGSGRTGDASSAVIPSESKLSKWIPSDSMNNGSSGDHHHSRGTMNRFNNSSGRHVGHSSPSYGMSHQSSHHHSHASHHSGLQSSSHMSSSTSNSFGTSSSSNFMPSMMSASGYSSRSQHTSSSSHLNQMSSSQHQSTHIPLPHASYFVSEDLRLDLIRKQVILYSSQACNSHAFQDIPLQVESYTDLSPIEENPGLESSFFGFHSSVFKATSMKTGQVVCLRRIHGYSPPSSYLKPLHNAIESWKKVVHTNLVCLRNVFCTKAFGDSSVIFVYDYFPAAQTLFNQYFRHSVKNSNAINGSVNPHASSTASSGGQVVNRPYSQQQTTKLLPEPLIWSYIIQLSSVIRFVHNQGHACRSLDASKVILTSGVLLDPSYVTNQALQTQLRQQPRLRLSSCGIADVVLFEQSLASSKDSQAALKAMTLQYQQEDLMMFGQLCLSLACNTLITKQDKWAASLDVVNRHYSPDLRSLILTLLSVKGSAQTRNINDIMPMIGARFYNHIDMTYQRHDIMETEVMKELDNSRLFRLICKLSSITERPEHRLDPQWSETGDRYLVKLFRDFLFHQVSEDGRPWLDMGHVITHLNRMEQSSPEKVCLVSRDEQNVLIVTYNEIKRCFESSFNDLLT